MTIGPAPMIRTDLMSVRLGIGSVLVHQIDEMVEKVFAIFGSRTRFRVPLKPERGPIRAADTLQRLVEQRHVRGLETVRQTALVDCKTMILARDDHAAVAQVFDRMIRAMVAMRHLDRHRAAREREQLMT